MKLRCLQVVSMELVRIHYANKLKWRSHALITSTTFNLKKDMHISVVPGFIVLRFMLENKLDS